MTCWEVSDVVCSGGVGGAEHGSNGFGESRVFSQRGQRGGGDPDDGVLAAAEDEVSAAIAALFSAHGQGFQALSAQAAATAAPAGPLGCSEIGRAHV